MSINVNDITITSLETITAFDIVSGAFKWVLDELQNATIANTQETTDITGKQGRLLNTLKRNKAVTVSGNNGLLSGGMLETQVGNTFKNKVTSIMYPDYLTVADGKAVTTYKAVGTAGNEIESVYLRNADGTLGEVLTQGDSVSTGVFTYDPATKTLTITFDDSIIPPGEAVTSLVSVTFSDGSVGESTEVLCAPKFNSLDLSIFHNTTDLLYVDFQFSGTCVLPSIGSIANLKVEIWPYDGEDLYLEYSHSDLSFNLEKMFQFTISEKLEFPGSPTTARAVLSGEWIVGERSFELRIPVSVTYPTEEGSVDTEDPDSSTEGNTENGESETTATEDGDSSAQTGSSANPTDPTETTGEAIQPSPTEDVIQIS